MADYTMKFKDYIDAVGGEIVTSDVGSVLNRADVVGLGAYPIHDPRYRVRLNGLIVDRFMNAEIGAETPSDFRRMLRVKMSSIMPFYSRMYKADELEFDPLRTIDMRTLATGESETQVRGETENSATSTDNSETTGDGTATTGTNTESNSGSRAVSSDTPQTMLKGNEDYATSATDQTGKTTTSGETTEANHTESNTTADSVTQANGVQSSDATDKSKSDSHVYGYNGAPGILISQYRESLVQTDTLVLKELEEVFMNIFGAGTIREPYGFYVSRY